MMSWMDGHMGWGGGAMMMTYSIFWLALVVVVAVAISRLAWPRAQEFRGSEPGPDEAIAAVRARYARGEIDRETYQRLLEDLGPRA